MNLRKKVKRKLKRILSGLKNNPAQSQKSSAAQQPTAASITNSSAAQPASAAASSKTAAPEGVTRAKLWLGEGTDADHVWAFRSERKAKGNEFTGNPKYLFVYINYYRPDIKAYFLCYNRESVDLIEGLGFYAVLFDSPEAAYLIDKTGVYVDECIRPSYCTNPDTKFLNLWHGWGYKPVERVRMNDDDDMRLDIAKKYISFFPSLLNNQILCAVNHEQEGYWYPQFGVEERQILRCGYARCTYQKKYKPISTYDHDFLGKRNLPENTRIAVWAPTFRKTRGNTFINGMKDLEEIYRLCEEEGILLIFKVHPHMGDEQGFLQAAKLYAKRPYFLFWDNENDFYEVMHRADLLIYDYSSIFSDFLLAGVKHYIRYLFDDDTAMNDWDEFYRNTRGRIVRTWEELLPAIRDFENDAAEEEPLDQFLSRIWEYAGDDDLEKTIQFALDFKVGHKELPTLYSFGIFDTLITRKALDSGSIFYAVKDKLIEDGSFPASFVRGFPFIRANAECGLRQDMTESAEQRHSFKTEITLDQIYEKIQEIEGLSDEQRDKAKAFECEAELSAVLPIKKRIDDVKALMAAGETVVLISDMYLPGTLILEMLRKADPALADLPFFLSNEYGVLKSDRLLFFEVYRSFGLNYFFGKWIHTGDNQNADQTQPRKLGISTRLIKKPEFNDTEREMAESIGTYDAFKAAAVSARLRFENNIPKADFVLDFVAPLLVTYVDWALHDALKRGFRKLYFVSRDGYHLKRIADAIIEAKGLELKTKYIYASRRLWRLPSYIDKVDDEFFQVYGGNFNDIFSKEQFLHAAYVKNEEDFKKLFSYIDIDGIDFSDWTGGQPARALAKMMRQSRPYHEYLLKEASEKRGIVCDYLLQEIDPDEPHAFVEFHGRGYNQLCHSRLWGQALGHPDTVRYYYANVVFPYKENCAVYAMNKTDFAMENIESIFANMPYKTVEEYEVRDGKIEPVIRPIDYDRDLFGAMEDLLPAYAKAYAGLSLSDPAGTDKEIFRYILRHAVPGKHCQIIPENTIEEPGVLSDEELEQSQKYQRLYEEAAEKIREFEKLYRSACSGCDVKPQVAFITNRKSLPDSFYSLKKELESRNVLGVETVCLGKQTDLAEVAEILAASEFIIASEPLPLLSGLRLRRESRLIMLSESAFITIGKGNAAERKLKWRMSYAALRYSVRADAVDGASEEGHQITYKRCGLSKYSTYAINGAAVTDVYFDESYRRDALNKLHEIYPEANGKKLILYMPNLRPRRYQPDYPQIIDLEELKMQLPDDYVVAVDTRNHKKLSKKWKYLLEAEGFSRLCNSKIRLRELVIAADIIIGDYRDILFEAALLEKPVFFSGADFEWVKRRTKNPIRDFSRIHPFPLVSDAKEAAKLILSADEYDYEPVRAFKDEYLSYCDGQTAKRILEYMGIE